MRRLDSQQRIAALTVLFIVAVTSLTASAQQTTSQSDQVHLYFFTMRGCAPCEMVKPAIEQLDRQGYPVTTIDIDQRPDWATTFDVKSTPTVAMVRGNKVIGFHAGVIRLPELTNWFRTAGVDPAAPAAPSAIGSTKQRSATGSFATEAPTQQARHQTRPMQTKTVLPSSRSIRNGDTSFSTPTMLRGTATPRGAAERAALANTVRLRVEDPKGTSYATGTVIHTHEGESLVITCGHVFRDSQGQGDVFAEFDFGDGQVQRVPAHLIDYDADARDIAVVVIQSGDHSFANVSIGSRTSTITAGRDVFSVGCDHGDEPTIRRTRIKNVASYDDAIKFDIYGRPVDGRSGGGLFTEAGELIGVCNAAAVEEDEGIYTALDTIHWQLAKVHLDHLFEPKTPPRSAPTIAAVQPVQPLSAAPTAPVQRTAPASSPIRPVSLEQEIVMTNSEPPRAAASEIPDAGNDSDQEVIIIVRPRSGVGVARTITVPKPTQKLLDYLDRVGPTSSTRRQLDVARYRAPTGPTRR